MINGLPVPAVRLTRAIAQKRPWLSKVHAMRRSHSAKSHARGYLLVLAVGLLIAQLGMLAHAIDHDLAPAQDRPHGTCLLCHAADHLGKGLVSIGLSFDSPALQTERTSSSANFLPPKPFVAFFARGPPAALWS